MKLSTSLLWRTVVSSTLALMLLPVASPTAYAQTTINSTAQLKQACETSANNAVLITYDASINLGASASTPEQVTTGCTINLTTDAEIGFDKVGMNFAGPLTINGANKSGVKLQDSIVSAPAITINLYPYSDTYVQLNNTKLQATAGNLAINNGWISKMEMKGQLAGGTLVASGAVNVTSGLKFSGAWTEVNVLAGTGFNVTMSLGETHFKVEQSTIETTAGNLHIGSDSFKTYAEITGSTLRAGGELNLIFSTVETGIIVTGSTLQSGGRAIVQGGTVRGINKITGGSLTAGGPVLIWLGSGVSGELSVGNTQISAVGELQFHTAFGSKTSVKDSTLNATNKLIIVSSTGICETANNTITAPLTYLCGVTNY